jgi:hypothetical protein
MEPEDRMENIRMKNQGKVSHYYGDIVRNLYIVMAVVMLVVTPFVKDDFSFPAYFSIFAVLVLLVFAGFTNPKLKSVLIFDFLISVIALLIFGHEMILSYSEPYTRLFFITNIVLSVISIFALYFSSKTLRGNLLSKSQ